MGYRPQPACAGYDPALLYDPAVTSFTDFKGPGAALVIEADDPSKKKSMKAGCGLQLSIVVTIWNCIGHHIK